MHDDHWMEPKSLTEQRAKEERWCESCGEEIPYHNVSCALLKSAYKTRKRKCDHCLKVFPVGRAMFNHMWDEHADILNEMGIVKPT